MTNLVFELPRRLEGSNVFRAVERLLPALQDGPDAVEISFADVTFIRPTSVVFLRNFIHWLDQKGCKVTLSGVDINRSPIRYLDDSQFFMHHFGKNLRSSSARRTTTIPLKDVANGESHAWLEIDFLPWLMANSGLSKNSLAELKTCIQELFNNITDHTTCGLGCVFGQWYYRS